MPATPKSGLHCKVTLGASTILGMGTWSVDGIQSDSLETTELGQAWKTFQFGLNDGGNLSFSGLFDPADVTGQNALRAANLTKLNITTLRLYVDNTSYFEPCRTTGYFGPGALSTGYDTFLSYVNVTSYNVKADKSGLLMTDFQAKISGCMVLV